jgi:demethylmenaquinone methyltransferase / 2-methoxy-6-polyprenyl-1,4-benzoquinol methylase
VTIGQLDGSCNAAGFSSTSDDVFGRIAARYDLLGDLFSLGIHRLWKRRVAEVISREPWSELLDVASGTADIVLRILERHPAGKPRHIVAGDINPQMLEIARRRLPQTHHTVDVRRLDAHSQSGVAADSVDLYSISLGLKICERRAVLREAMRVLRPGGRLIVLEASRIPLAWLQSAYLLYMSICIPVIGWMATGGDASAYRYLLQGIRDFPAAEELAAEIRHFGFEDVTFERLSLGIAAIHLARKPS